MRKLVLAAVSVAALTGLAACQNPAEKEADARADAVEAQADVTATQLENQADAVPTDAQADALNAQADAVEKKADEKADAIKAEAGNVDGGMTTSNTPPKS